MAREAERLLGDENPLVRGAAVWALSQLIGREKFSELASEAIGAEVDKGVREEWRVASQHSVVMLRESGASSTPRQ
jgi:epoxyqueuosine reductase